MKYVKSFESHRSSKLEPINEELLGGVINFFKNMWKKATDELKKLGDNPSAEKVEEWVEKNVMNPQDDNYILKSVMEEFTKKPEANEQDCLDLIKNILDPEVGAFGKQGLQPFYDNIIAAFGKDGATLDIVKFINETIRNRAIKDYKYAGGPDLKVGVDPKIDPKKIIIDMKDTTHLPDFKKVILTAQQDNKKRKQLAIDWVNKTLVPRLDKYISEIPPGSCEKYIESLGKTAPEEAPEGGYKVGDSVIYKREKFVQEEWNKVTDDEKKKPEEGKMKELQAEQIGIKTISKIEGDKISFEGAEFTKTMGDILMKVEGAEKAEGQEDLVKKLGDLKTKNPENIKKVGTFVDFISDEANKDKVTEIEKIIGGGEEAA